MTFERILSNTEILGFVTNSSTKCTFAAYVGSGFVASAFLFAGPYMCTSFVGQAFFAGCSIAFGNGYSGLMAPLAIDIMGIDVFHVAFGTGLTVCGIGFIIGPPIAGALYDYTGSYYYTFIFAGSCYLFAQIILVLGYMSKSIRTRAT